MTAPDPAPPTTVAGGATVPMHPTFTGVQLQPWSFWNQMTDPAMDGDPGSGPNAPNDCGPESVAMCLAHLTDLALDADYIWDCIQQSQHPPSGPGYTSIQDLEAFLNTTAGINTQLLAADPAKQYADPDVQGFLHAIRNALCQGHPLIGLFSFTAPNAPDGHFRPIIGDTGHYLLTADPARGFIPPHGPRVEGYRTFWAWSKGFAIELKRKRCVAL